MSAIPWVGQDIVESKNITECFLGFSSKNTICLLPTIGVINKNAIKKLNKKIRLDKEDYLSIPPSFIGFLVGLIDGDGYIQITKTTKGFIAIKLVISIHLHDISTLLYIHSVLRLGKITTYPDNRSPACKLIINRTDLQEVLFPLLLHHDIYFLTSTRVTQFNLAMNIMKQDIKLYDNITNEKDIVCVFNLPNTALGYTNLPFFNDWIVGFTMAEGSFLVKKNDDACFQLKQRIDTNLFESFKLVFDTSRKIGNDNGLYNQFGVSSKDDVQKVINFFTFSGIHPLIGLKGIQYLKWLNYLRNSNRYKNLNLPAARN